MAVRALADGHVRRCGRRGIPAIACADEYPRRRSERRGGSGEEVHPTARGVLADDRGGQSAGRDGPLRGAELEPARRVRGTEPGGWLAATRAAVAASEQLRDVRGDDARPEGGRRGAGADRRRRVECDAAAGSARVVVDAADGGVADRAWSAENTVSW